MSEITMPALVGNDPLGFLAALGVLRLTTTELGWQSTLCWPNGPRNGAVLGGVPEGATVESVAAALSSIVEATKEVPDRLIPGVDGFPPIKSGNKGMEPAKDMSFADRSGIAKTSISNPLLGDWLLATVSIGSPDTVKPDDRVSAVYRRTSQGMTLGGALKSISKDLTEERFRQALLEWERVEGSQDHNLDIRALRPGHASAGDNADIPNAAVPGASWLALMSFPFFPARTSLSGKALTTGFDTTQSPHRMIWPVWSSPCSMAAIQALLDHPLIRRVDGARVSARARNLILLAFHVDAVFSSARRPNSVKSFNGALGPAEVIASVRLRGST